MVIVKLMGGMGNQMFQYAAARHLALHLKTKLKLDLMFLLDRKPRENFTFRSYALSVFNVHASVASTSDLALFENAAARAGWHRYLQPFGDQYKPCTVFRERSFRFDPGLLRAKGNVYLEGFWQSEKYFQQVATTIREDFRFARPLSAQGVAVGRRIAGLEAVSLHLRRGDYVQNAATHAFHGVCTLDYYRDAVEYVAERVRNPYFFVFSDDITWAEENLRLSYPVEYVSPPEESDGTDDMRLMSICKHHIIANSSFSWWGAWLNPNPCKIVVAPRRWFSEPAMDASDLVPDNWIRL